MGCDMLGVSWGKGIRGPLARAVPKGGGGFVRPAETNRHGNALDRPPPTATNRHPPTNANCHQPPTTLRQPPTVTNHQPPPTANHCSKMLLWSCVLTMKQRAVGGGWRWLAVRGCWRLASGGWWSRGAVLKGCPTKKQEGSKTALALAWGMQVRRQAHVQHKSHLPANN